ncbi:AAA family ATPase [Pseudooceanicola marinus]|uniref:AAA family ATPase n=1 Tax=Pseudooceanicola marinus TaxID=396013 RepID=UPI001CD6F8A8|nr:AAA family ATPase [Pseudooceanicola marinus]MCA1334427.1 AAA family ATPase [Pseudooceanicola marinus]
MQILSIRGENIASLAKPFEICLDDGPLASAGLFAITGETGAGKSSLLDAMCLALYGDCPRLSGSGTREAVEDVDGSALRATDARMVLRRGAARGLAEVTFRATDGEVYTAGWSARRARDRIDGRLQAVDRSLVRASDGQVLESQLSRVNDRVTELTGLTYDEFRRTVLLAQGDFDAFLSAQTGERAAILEKVTGTQVYRDISRRIYERNTGAQSALEALEIRRGEHPLLSAEERAALETESEALRARKTATEAELTQVTADLGRYAAQEAAQTALTRAEARVSAAEAALTAMADQQAWLADWDRAQALRGELREDQAAQAALREAVEAEAQLTEAEREQGEAAEALAETAAAAQARLDQVEAAFKALGPEWTKAEQFDSRIVGATEELTRAEAELTRRQADAGAAEDKQTALEAEDRRLADARAEAQAALEQIPGHEGLRRDWSALEERLEARIAAATRLREAEEARAALKEATAAQTRTRDEANAETAALTARLADLRQQQADLQPERRRLQAAAPATALATLGQQLIDLRALRQAAAQVREADHAIAESAARQRAALESREQAETDGQRLAEELKTASHHIDALSRPVASAEAAVSAEADHLRQHLEPGRPCPVCHATEHPVLDDSALSRLATELRQQMQAATEARDTAQAALRDATTRRDEAAATIAREEAEAPALTERLAERIEDHARQWAALEVSALPDLPTDPRAADSTFATLLEALEARRPALEEARDRLALQERDHQRLGQEIETAQAQLTARTEQAAALTAALADSEARAKDLARDCDTAQREIAALAPRLVDPLAALGLSPEAFDADGQPALDALRETAGRAGALLKAIEETETARTAQMPALTEARSAARTATNRVTEAIETRDSRKTTLESLRADRAELLGGEATGPHRTRHNEARKAAQAAASEAQRQHAEARARLAQIAGSLEAAQTTLTRATARRHRAAKALTEACTAAGLDLDRVQALHATEADVIESRRAALNAAETERTSALGARDERQQEWDALQADGLPETPREDLQTRKDELAATATTLSEELGALSERRKADTRAREALAGLEAEIEAARKVADTWAAINDAIGSARGDRFAQIAQAVTLAMLVERANLHLDQLKPRYQLAVADQDLALHVIDRDMAGDTRPSRLLSGGERFLVSLSLALALSGMGSRGALAGTLFIDEGFGSLDAESLDLAIDALERLQAQGRTIGVISHVQAMKDRIPVQLEVTKTGGGASEIALRIT